MAFHVQARTGRNQPQAEINMIPLIDVMLVLLIIFMVTAPLLTHGVKVDLPKATSQAADTPPKTIQASIRADGSLYWEKEALRWEALPERLAAQAALEPQPELHIRADSAVAYGKVAELMSAASAAGITKIGFITAPTAPKP